MIRTLVALAVLLAAVPGAFAQLIVRPPPAIPRPAGVIQPPALPIPGQPIPPGFTPPARLPIQPAFANPFFNPFGFGVGYPGYWPGYYEPETRVVNNIIPSPSPIVYINQPSVTPPPAPELRSRLTLTVPFTARVWLGGKEVDANASPIVLESPVLERGQSYTFNVKVALPDGAKTDEQTRTVTVAAGDSKSLAILR